MPAEPRAAPDAVPPGVILLRPGEGRHCNRTGERAGVLNVFIPGEFEVQMPGIVEWFRTHR